MPEDVSNSNIAGSVKQKVRDILTNPPDPQEELREFSTLAGRELYGFGEAAVDIAASLFDPKPAKKSRR